MADELKKIDLETSPKKSFPWKFIVVPLGIIAVIVVLIGVMLLPLRGVIAKAQDVMRVGKEAGAAIKNQDLEKSKASLLATREQLVLLDKEYAKIKPLKMVPILGNYVADGEHAIKAGFAGLDAAGKAIEALEPNADLLGLKGKSTFVSGTADERIQTAVKTMNALTPKVNEMALSIDTL
ncbi:MAG: hypothetical protein AAB889_00415, partial [Patescibacteria group bacterium]